MTKATKKGGAFSFGGRKGHGTPVEDDAVEPQVEAQPDRLPDDFKVVPVYHCGCDHSTRANGFCKHGNNL